MATSFKAFDKINKSQVLELHITSNDPDLSYKNRNFFTT